MEPPESGAIDVDGTTSAKRASFETPSQKSFTRNRLQDFGVRQTAKIAGGTSECGKLLRVGLGLDSAAYSWLEEGEWYDPGCEGADSAAYSWLEEAEEGEWYDPGGAARTLRPTAGWKRASGTTQSAGADSAAYSWLEEASGLTSGARTLKPASWLEEASGTTRAYSWLEEGEWHDPGCGARMRPTPGWKRASGTTRGARARTLRPTPGWKRSIGSTCHGSLLDEVANKLRDEWRAATVVAPSWTGQMWFHQLEALADEVVILPRCNDLLTPSRLGGSELFGASSRDGIIFHNSTSRVQDTTVGNYRPKAEKFMQFSVAEDWSWFLTTEATVRPYIARLMSKGAIQDASL
ncbi:hypothetical protein CYMTET_25242 [Cymbomonas tetramitiformis]|uniref:Uncharacterized protein n=1 Tax=Cymbomonas tetramitiformis TaxID=36881 RepID=A0AAE0FU30_9CHLO|nr:hypothetical protein CYMTET_25242 [Cymbomonas tetramitiformis]